LFNKVTAVNVHVAIILLQVHMAHLAMRYDRNSFWSLHQII